MGIEAAGSLARAQALLNEGGLVVIPTDTVYGVAARLDKPETIARIFEVKRRPRSKPIAVLVADLETAMRIGAFTKEARRLAEEGWPGALTLVVPSVNPLPQLGGDGTTVGLRVPDHEWTLKVLRECGPLATTSANPSGSPTAGSIDEIFEELGDSVELYIDGGRLESPPSKVISLVGEPEVLRPRVE